VLSLRSWVRGRFHSGSLLRSRAVGAIAATPAAKEHRKPRLFPSDAPRSLEIFNKLGDHTVRVRRATMRTVTTTEDRGVRYRDFRNLQYVIGGAALAYGLRVSNYQKTTRASLRSRSAIRTGAQGKSTVRRTAASRTCCFDETASVQLQQNFQAHRQISREVFAYKSIHCPHIS
jgi:hypothetical protein